MKALHTHGPIQVFSLVSRSSQDCAEVSRLKPQPAQCWFETVGRSFHSVSNRLDGLCDKKTKDQLQPQRGKTTEARIFHIACNDDTVSVATLSLVAMLAA